MGLRGASFAASIVVAFALLARPARAEVESAPAPPPRLHGALDARLEFSSYGMSLGNSTFRGDGYESNTNHDLVSLHGRDLGVRVPRFRGVDLGFGSELGLFYGGVVLGVGGGSADSTPAVPADAPLFDATSILSYRFGAELGMHVWVLPALRFSLTSVFGAQGASIAIRGLYTTPSGVSPAHVTALVGWIAPRVALDLRPFPGVPFAFGAYVSDNLVQPGPSLEAGVAISATGIGL